MNRTAQAIVLFLVGAAMLHATFTDLYLRYVKAGLRPLLLGAGAVLIMAAIATVWVGWRERSTVRAIPAGSGHHDRHVHREPRISWLLLLPLLALTLVAPPALGSYTAVRSGTLQKLPWGIAPLPTGDPLPLGMVEYAGRAIGDHGRSISDRQITLTGFVTYDDAGNPMLVRMVLNCCAADAQPVKIGLTGQIPPVLPSDGWLEVTGTYTAEQAEDPVNGGIIPFIDVLRTAAIPAPADQYES